MKIFAMLLSLALAGCAATPPPTDKPATTAPAAVMPKVTGMRLNEAKELLATKGYAAKEEDGTGQGRAVLEPANWVVDAQLPEAGAEASSGTTVTLKVRKPTDGSSAAPAVRGTVPKVVCMDLQTAQDTLQAAGFRVLQSEDATGQGRQQVADRNWVVVSQSAEAGSKPDPAAKITLAAVKFGEPTGASGCAS